MVNRKCKKEGYISPEIEVILLSPERVIAGSFGVNNTPWSNGYEQDIDNL